MANWVIKRLIFFCRTVSRVRFRYQISSSNFALLHCFSDNPHTHHIFFQHTVISVMSRYTYVYLSTKQQPGTVAHCASVEREMETTREHHFHLSSLVDFTGLLTCCFEYCITFFCELFPLVTSPPLIHGTLLFAYDFAANGQKKSQAIQRFIRHQEKNYT